MYNKYIKIKILNNKINQSFTYMIDLSSYSKLEYGDLLLVKFNHKFQIGFYVSEHKKLNDKVKDKINSTSYDEEIEIGYKINKVLEVLKQNRINEYGKHITEYIYKRTFNNKEHLANMVINKNEMKKNKLEITYLKDLEEINYIVVEYIKEHPKTSKKEYLSEYFKTSTLLYNNVKKEHIKLFDFLYEKKAISITLQKEKQNKIKLYKSTKSSYKYMKKSTYLLANNITNYKFNKQLKDGLIKEKVINSYEYIEEVDRTLNKYELTDYQEKAYNKIKNLIIDKPILLRGITGSGKTAIFINLIEEHIKKGEQVLLLVPEMILARQIIKTMIDAFGEVCGYYSNDITEKQKGELLNKIKNNYTKIIVGTRSSVFLEIPNLKLVIIDEEHDTSYKQNFSPYYDVHELIDFYTSENIRVLLSSATPLISTYAKAQKGIYELVELTKRYNNYSTPKITFKNYDKDNIINDNFINYLKESLNNKEKVLILFNIKGYSRTVECSDCYDIATCPNCNIPLKYYKESNSCECSYCDFEIRNYQKCQSCGSYKLKYIGLGIEKVETELQKHFKNKVLRIDSKVAKTKKLINEILKEFNDEDQRILLGTQIVSKGLNFSNLNKVIVLNLDNMLYFDDFAAYEKTYQLLEQVSGRSGRSKEQGEVIIYTNHESTYVYDAVLKNDYNRFYKEEMHNRKLQKSIPYYYIAQVEFRDKDKEKAKKIIENIKRYIENENKELIITNVIKPYIEKIGNEYRYKIYIKYKKDNIRHILKQCINNLEIEHLNILIDLKITDYGY